MTTNTRIVLAARPQGQAGLEHFRLETVPFEPLQDGQVRVRHHYLSLDPYMRGRMNEGKSYAAPQPLDEVMIGGTAGEVIESRHPRYSLGDWVVGMGGWQQHSVVDANPVGALHRVDPTHVPLSHYLGTVSSRKCSRPAWPCGRAASTMRVLVVMV